MKFSQSLLPLLSLGVSVFAAPSADLSDRAAKPLVESVSYTLGNINSAVRILTDL